jgi:hypothetical protein
MSFVSWGMSDSPVGRSILAGQVGLLCYCEVRLGHEAKKFLAVLCVGRTVKDDLHRIATGLPQTLVQQEF